MGGQTMGEGMRNYAKTLEDLDLREPVRSGPSCFSSAHQPPLHQPTQRRLPGRDASGRWTGEVHEGEKTVDMALQPPVVPRREPQIAVAPIRTPPCVGSKPVGPWDGVGIAEPAVQEGVVSKWLHESGYGFLTRQDGGKDLFVHRTEIRDARSAVHQAAGLVVGKKVMYKEIVKEGRPRAADVHGPGVSLDGRGVVSGIARQGPGAAAEQQPTADAVQALLLQQQLFQQLLQSQQPLPGQQLMQQQLLQQQLQQQQLLPGQQLLAGAPPVQPEQPPGAVDLTEMLRQLHLHQGTPEWAGGPPVSRGSDPLLAEMAHDVPGPMLPSVLPGLLVPGSVDAAQYAPGALRDAGGAIAPMVSSG
eukprot:TRINITY_DN1448_c0_g1_i1.p1 TRINITY_DN1448_c0_g1~~TRINITY_DN1448_c0_g1_i1.p1  ORF type:complete len:360 (+),score=85.63 TRINITY_DN1448_c0_g1_i1:43-1122(+)